jgi:tetratricopeptide (TPR) repeat protein
MGGDRRRGLAAGLERDHENLRAALSWSLAESDWQEAARLAVALHPFWEDRCLWREGHRLLQAVLSARPPEHRQLAPQSPANDSAEGSAAQEAARSFARLHYAAAKLAWLVADLPAARSCLAESLALSRAAGDRRVACLALRFQGHLALDKEGGHADARALYLECLDLQRDLADPWGMAASHYSLGCAAFVAEEFDRAREHWHQSLVLRRTVGDCREILLTLWRLSFLHYTRGEYASACALMEELIAVLRQREPDGSSPSPAELPDLAVGNSPGGAAVSARVEAVVAILRGRGDRRALAFPWLRYAGRLAFDLGEFDRAGDHWEQELALNAEFGDREHVARALTGLGAVAVQRGSYDEAERFLRESLAVSAELGHRATLPAALLHLGRAASDQRRFGSARAYLDQSLQYTGNRAHEWSAACSFDARALLDLRQGHLTAAREGAETALALRRKSGERRGIALSLISLGRVLTAHEELEPARGLLEEAQVLLTRHGDCHAMALCLEALGRVWLSGGEPDRAARLFGAAHSLRETLGAPIAPADRDDHDRQIESLRWLLGDDAFAAAFRHSPPASSPL